MEGGAARSAGSRLESTSCSSSAPEKRAGPSEEEDEDEDEEVEEDAIYEGSESTTRQYQPQPMSRPQDSMSSKGAKRSRRIADEASGPHAAGEEGGGARGSASAATSAAAPAAATALVRSRHRSAPEAEDGAGGAALAVGITVEMSRFVEEQLRGVRREMETAQRDHARELAAVNRELAAVRCDHSRELAAVREELADARYETSRRFVLLDSRGATSEIGLVCRRGGFGPDEYNEYRSVLSVLFGFQEFSDLGDGLMRFFTTGEARELRLVHSEFLDAVTATPWRDRETVIAGPIAAWRASFPNAQAAKLGTQVVDADFVHLRGLRSLDMTDCKRVSDAAFVNLRGIGDLKMRNCDQPNITAGSFTHLKGIQELDMEICALASQAVASGLIQGARSLPSDHIMCLIRSAILKGNVPECRRLLDAATTQGSNCWLYAGVTFRDLPTPASAYDVLATSCLTLLRVGSDVESVSIVNEAVNCLLLTALSDLGSAACVDAGAISALVAAAALNGYGKDVDACRILCQALTCLSEGRDACLTAAQPIVSALKLHAASESLVKVAFNAIFCMAYHSPGTAASFVSLGAVQYITAAFQKCSLATSLCLSFTQALYSLAFPPHYVNACLAAGAVPLLLVAYAKDASVRGRAVAILARLGYDSRGELFP